MPPAMTTVRGFNLWECLSALQKAIRRCDEAAALTFAVEMDQSGHGVMLWNRLLIIASEDIGLAEPHLPATLHALHESWKQALSRNNKNRPERLFIVHAVMLISRAKKSRIVDNAIWATYAVEEPLVKEIPDYALDGHTQRGRELGRGVTTATNPEGYAIENGIGDKDNVYFRRKEEYRARVGFAKSKEVFSQQGRRGRGEAVPDQEADMDDESEPLSTEVRWGK